MRTIDPATQAQADAGAIIEQFMILFDFPSGMYGFWTGPGDFTHNTVTYKPGGSLIELEPVKETEGLQSQNYTARLRAIPNSDLTPDVLASIESENYHKRPVTIDAAYFSPDAPLTALSVEREWRGYIDQIAHLQQGGEYVLEARLESRSRDNFRRGYRVRSQADQERIDANDGFLRHVAVVPEQQPVWGRAT